MRRAVWSLLALLPACAGVSVRSDDRPLPRTVAVLPLQGAADARLRTLCRALLVSGLRQHGLQVVETEHTDRILAEYGWLGDPEVFRPEHVGVDRACHALGVDAVLAGTGFDQRSFNLLLVRRHVFTGEVQLRRVDGSQALQISARAARGGGLLLQSGQILSELRAQGEHGTPREAVALVDALVDDVLAALPPLASPPAVNATGGRMDVALHAADLVLAAGTGSESRLTIRGTVPPGTRVWLDFDSATSGIPASERSGAFSVSLDADPARLPGSVRLRARDGFGNTASVEVKQ